MGTRRAQVEDDVVHEVQRLESSWEKSIEERYIRTLCCAFGHRTGWLATAQAYPGRWRMSINSNTNLVAEEEGVECK